MDAPKMDLFIRQLLNRIRNPAPAAPSIDDYLNDADYSDSTETEKVVYKRIPIYIEVERHKKLRRKLLDDDVSFNALANELITVYLES